MDGKCPEKVNRGGSEREKERDGDRDREGETESEGKMGR